MRARSLRLHPQTLAKLIRLKKEADQQGQYRVGARVQAVLLNHDGKTSGEIAYLLRRPRSRVTEWLKNYDDHGYEGLLEGHRAGRPAELTPKQKQQLCDIVDSGPVAYGFLSGVWSSVMIAKVIREEFSVSYHPGHVRKLLYDLGFSVQRPKRLLAKADPGKQDQWTRYTYPNIKKKPTTKAPR